MKRDMDLVRKILLGIEEAPFDGAPIELQIEGYDTENISYHCLILTEAGLITSVTTSLMGHEPDDSEPIRLTWKGHEFLDAARDDRTWKKAVKVIGRQGGVAFEVLIKYLMQELEQKVLGASSTGP